MQKKKKGWDIPVTDGTPTTEGDITGSAYLAALFNSLDGVHRPAHIFVLAGRKTPQESSRSGPVRGTKGELFQK